MDPLVAHEQLMVSLCQRHIAAVETASKRKPTAWKEYHSSTVTLESVRPIAIYSSNIHFLFTLYACVSNFILFPCWFSAGNEKYNDPCKPSNWWFPFWESKNASFPTPLLGNSFPIAPASDVALLAQQHLRRAQGPE